ncbi:30012_t:CDS:1, partial [Gigaspora margarita]
QCAAVIPAFPFSVVIILAVQERSSSDNVKNNFLTGRGVLTSNSDLIQTEKGALTSDSELIGSDAIVSFSPLFIALFLNLNSLLGGCKVLRLTFFLASNKQLFYQH